MKKGKPWTVDIAGKQWKGQSFEYIDKGLWNDFEKDYQFIKECFKYRNEMSVEGDL